MARAPDPPEESDYVVSGDELKLIVRLARRRAMPFAFCPDSDSDEPLFATHRKKPPEMIARVTRRDSGQSKIAFGTFVVQGRLMVLTCLKELPAIAKKLKRHLKAQKLPMNVRVLDMGGQELEADIEDFDDTDPLGAGDDDDADPLDLRIAAMRPAVLGLKGQRGDRLRELFAALLTTRGNGPRDHAEDLADRLEDELQRLRNSGHRPMAASPRAVEVRQEEVEEEDDPAGALRLARRARALHRRVAGLADDAAAGRLAAALQLAVGALRAGETDSAAGALDRIDAALARVEDRARAG